MIIYTIMPHEYIYAQQNPDKDYLEESFYYKGILVTAERTSPYQYRIIKITSTNPDDYLINDIQPGKYIDFLHF
ncbi:MAG: YlzJ-like family protein [Bacillus sp. (in: firmicutes)]